MPMKMENENIIRRFLFGEMPEEERFEFEEKFIADAVLFEQIKTVEDELIEKYVRGWMDPAERSKFEKHFLNTKKRRERVEFSRLMISKVKEEAPVFKKNNEVMSEDSVWQKLAGLLLTPQVAVAFTILVVSFGGWILYQNFGSRESEIVKSQNEEVSQTPEKSFTPTPENSSSELPKNLKDNLSNKNSTNINTTVKKTPKPVNSNNIKTPTPTKTPIVKVAPNPVLALFAGRTRSGGKNSVLNLPRGSKGATLVLNLESVDYKTYQAQLTDADGRVVFARGNLKARKLKIGFFLSAKNLKKGDYIIKLNGKNISGENESVADYQFRIK